MKICMKISKTLMEVESRRVVSNITCGGSNRVRGSAKRSREKGSMNHFFTPNVKMIVQNRSGKMTKTVTPQIIP